MDRELRNRLEREVREHYPSVQAHFDVTGRGHPKLVLRGQRMTRHIVTSKTPSDHRAVRNAVSLMRRTLREMGEARR